MKLILLTLLFSFVTSLASLATTPRWRNPASINGNTDWANPDNVKVSDDARASEIVFSPVIIECETFSLNLRDDQSADSIVIGIEGYSEAAISANRIIEVQITLNGTVGVGDKIEITLVKDVETLFEVNGTTDALFGLNPTVAELNATTFGVFINQKNDNVDSLILDHVRIKVFASGAGNCSGCREYRTDRANSNAEIKDGDPREASKTQARGTVTTLQFGTNAAETDDRHLVFNDTLIFGDDIGEGTTGIPTGQEMKACTLWLQFTALPVASTAEVVYDLYKITEKWNEAQTNVVSWDNRQSGPVTWTTPGVTGTLMQDSAIGFRKFATDTVQYRLYDAAAGELAVWDTFIVPVGDTFPIPLPLAVCECIYDSTCYGIAMKYRIGPAELSFYNVGSAENATEAARPMFQWVYIGQVKRLGKTQLRKVKL